MSMDPTSERPLPSPIGNQETGNIYNREDFSVLLEYAIGEATISEGSLSLFIVQPLGQINQDDLGELAQIITK